MSDADHLADEVEAAELQAIAALEAEAAERRRSPPGDAGRSQERGFVAWWRGVQMRSAPRGRDGGFAERSLAP